MAANKKANQTDGPVLAAANPGKTKIPPSIPPMLIAITEVSDNLLSNFFKVLFYFL